MAPFILPAQHSNDSESNYYNDIYTADSTEVPTSSSLSQNKAYTNYLPNLAVALSALYISTFLLRYVWAKCRRYRDRKRQQEKQRWKLAWKKAVTKCQLKDSFLFDDNQKHRLVSPPPTYDVYSSTSSLTLNSQSCHFDSSVITFISEPSTSIRDCNSLEKSESSCSNNTKSSNYTICNKEDERDKKQLVTKTRTDPNGYHRNEKHGRPTVDDDDDDDDQSKYNLYRVIRNYWKISNNKRLNLLWQWSVSMGYCEYSHAKELDDLVLRLQSSREHSSQDSNETFLLAEEELLESNAVDQEKRSNQVTLDVNNVQSSNDKSERIL